MRRTSSTLVGIVLILVALGLVMLASTSSVKGSASFGDPQHFLKKQLIWLIISVISGAILVRFDYHHWEKLAVPVVVSSVVLLGLVFLPGIGHKAGGSHRWLSLGPLSFQPSEYAKFAAVVGLAAWMASVGRKSTRFKEGLLYPVLGLGVVLGLLFLEPDFGTTLLVGTVGLSILFAGGTRVAYLAVTAFAGLSAFVTAIFMDPVRAKRVLAFLMPDEYPESAYHLMQSKAAFIGGGWWGVGLGESMQKQFYLPEAHTDFILAIIGEELGFVATGVVVLLFLGILVCGLIISAKASEPFGGLLAFGITMMLCLQASINIGVVTGCLPTKGLPLPFISYGGSSLLLSICSVCVLLNIAQHAVQPEDDEHARPIRDREHQF